MQCLDYPYFGTVNLDQGCFGTAIAREVSALSKIPDEISSEYAGPLMCAGVSKSIRMCYLSDIGY
jgi:D-arabinose 1-dehydrogenase-like Zn-dependent alcohol dehydrogenase